MAREERVESHERRPGSLPRDRAYRVDEHRVRSLAAPVRAGLFPAALRRRPGDVRVRVDCAEHGELVDEALDASVLEHRQLVGRRRRQRLRSEVNNFE